MTYYTVTLKAFAFETKEQAQAIADKLLDAFCDMPEADGYGASAIIEDKEEAAARLGPSGRDLILALKEKAKRT